MSACCGGAFVVIFRLHFPRNGRWRVGDPPGRSARSALRRPPLRRLVPRQPPRRRREPSARPVPCSRGCAEWAPHPVRSPPSRRRISGRPRYIGPGVAGSAWVRRQISSRCLIPIPTPSPCPHVSRYPRSCPHPPNRAVYLCAASPPIMRPLDMITHAVTGRARRPIFLNVACDRKMAPHCSPHSTSYRARCQTRMSPSLPPRRRTATMTSTTRPSSRRRRTTSPSSCRRLRSSERTCKPCSAAAWRCSASPWSAGCSARTSRRCSRSPSARPSPAPPPGTPPSSHVASPRVDGSCRGGQTQTSPIPAAPSDSPAPATSASAYRSPRRRSRRSSHPGSSPWCCGRESTPRVKSSRRSPSTTCSSSFSARTNAKA